MKYQVKKCKGGWYWRIVAGNGKVLAHSEVYKRRHVAARVAGNVKRASMYCELEVENG